MARAALQPSSHSKILLDKAQDRAFWTSYFQVPEPELRAAIAAVGNYLVVLEDYFSTRRGV